MRSYWHPYTDDTSPARVDVSHADCGLSLIGAVPTLADHVDTPGFGLFVHALRRRQPIHSPRFGCLFHQA